MEKFVNYKLTSLSSELQWNHDLRLLDGVQSYGRRVIAVPPHRDVVRGIVPKTALVQHFGVLSKGSLLSRRQLDEKAIPMRQPSSLVISRLFQQETSV